MARRGEDQAAVTTLVTGGNGWLPSHVVRRLARAGETVVSYDLMEPDDYLRAFLGADISNVVFESGDVTDRERLSASGGAARRHQHHQRRRDHTAGRP